jgi:hypothetical protein
LREEGDLPGQAEIQPGGVPYWQSQKLYPKAADPLSTAKFIAHNLSTITPDA